MLPNQLLSGVFMSLPNPILQWNSGYLQTDSPALQVFDQSRPNLLSIRRLLVVQQPDLRNAPGPAVRPAGGQRRTSRSGSETGGRLGLRVAPQQVTLTASARFAGGRLRGQASGAQWTGPRRGCGPLRGARAGSPGGRLRHRRGSAGGGWGFPPPGGRARRGGLGGGGGGTPHPQDWDPKRRSPPDSESESLREVRFRAPGALLLEPEPRCPLPAPRASSPGPATGSSIRCSAGAAAIPRAAAAAAPLRPGGAAHPPSLPRTAR